MCSLMTIRSGTTLWGWIENGRSGTFVTVTLRCRIFLQKSTRFCIFKGKMYLDSLQNLWLGFVPVGVSKRGPGSHRWLSRVVQSKLKGGSCLKVELYAEYEQKMLLPFIRSSQHYRLDKVQISIHVPLSNYSGLLTMHHMIFVLKKDLVREQVFILGRMGNVRQALSVIINQLEDMEEGVELCDHAAR
ncbi:hypothetical protein OPV22_018792 [Ensete ventricosum]|uniref:Uncharacterized protein n=1 Tax=Ensete ventricosum TaxID=4639 RepID=A0AAV8R134_ENSVE|nr:hypothetical protein OPV22_018792 [Ensete ventricosum]